MKAIWTYIAIAFALSWAVWLPLAFAHITVTTGMAWPTHLLGLTGPALAAVSTTALFEGKAGLADLWRRIIRWRFRWQLWLVLLVTIGLVFLPLTVNSNIEARDFLTYSGAGNWGVWVIPYVLIINGFGEEIGWRGFLADKLLHKHSQGVTALLVWIVWGLWHLPLFWVVGTFESLGIGGTIGWALGLLSGSILLTWLYKSSVYSILLVALWHTAFNFSSATTASAGVGAAVSSTLVMVASVLLLCLPWFWRRLNYQTGAR